LRQLVDDALHLRRGDVLGAGYDNVLHAIREIEETLGIEVADVAGAEPVAEEGGFGFFRISPIAPGDLGAAQADLSALAGRKHIAFGSADLALDMGKRASDRADLLKLAVGLHHRVATAGFGEPVGVDVACTYKEPGEGADARFGCALTAAYDRAN